MILLIEILILIMVLFNLGAIFTPPMDPDANKFHLVCLSLCLIAAAICFK